MTVRDMPVACSLDSHALSCRQSDLRASVLADAQSVDRLPNGIRWTFQHAPDLFARLGPIIDGERHCCRFLHVAILAAQDLGTVTLEITGPIGTVDFLEHWISPTP
jgi:hypothetical protein